MASVFGPGAGLVHRMRQRICCPAAPGGYSESMLNLNPFPVL
jgi:hypothetical protein